MANQTFKRQIERISRELDSFKPTPPAIVLTEPRPDADPATVAAYVEQLAQARNSKNGAIVIGCRLPGQPMREQVAGVRYVDSEWEAAALTLAGQPSEFGNKNAFEDLLKSLPGTTRGVTAKVPMDIYQRGATLDQ